jgi:cytochrome c553
VSALGLALAAAAAAAADAETIAATVCVACHGRDGNSAVPVFPNIAGLQEGYIIKQLREFMNGQRKSDVMAPIVAKLKPEDLAPLAAHFSSQRPKPGVVHDASLADEGRKFYADGNEVTGVPACVGCHQSGASGYSIYPRLAGQHPEYLLRQLQNFASGDRSNDVGRYMRVIAKRMTEREMRAVAEYIGSLGADAPQTEAETW